MNRFLRILLVGLLLLVLVAVSYRSTWNLGFLEWDDDMYVTENPVVAEGLTWGGVKYAFTTLDTGNYAPLTWLSYELDASIAGINSRCYHLVNAGLHWLNSLLVFLAAWKLTGAWNRSLLVAALFAVHPLHVESVAWVAERKDVLSTTFLFLAVLAWIPYARRPSVGSYLLVAVLMTLGLLTKSMLVTLPFLLFLVDIFLLDRIESTPPVTPLADSDEVRERATTSARKLRFLCVEKLPLLGLSFACGVITILAQQRAGSFQFGQPLPPSERLFNAIVATACYVRDTVCPMSLSAFYPHPVGTIPVLQVLGAAALLIGISCLAFLNGPQRKVTAFGWLWFLIALGPVIGIMQVGVQARADRYTYVPHFGLFLMLVWLAAEALERIRLPQAVLRGLAVVSVLAGMYLTMRQVPVWESSETLWRHALTIDPENELAHYNLGIAIARSRGPDPESYEHLQKVVDMGRHANQALYAMGLESQNGGNLLEAAEYYRRTLLVNPKNQDALHRLADILAKLDNRPMALAAFEEITKREPHSSEAWKRRGMIEIKQGMTDKAIASFVQAVQLDPSDWGAETNLGLALWQGDHLPEAAAHLERAVRLAPENPNGHVNLADAVAAMGNKKLAAEHYQKALELNPKDEDAQAKLRKIRDEMN